VSIVIDSRGRSLPAALCLAFLALPVPVLADPEPALAGEDGASLRRSRAAVRPVGIAGDAERLDAATFELEPAIAAESDIPAAERLLDTTLATVPAYDHDGRAFGTSDGKVCVLMLDDFTLRSRYSADGGNLFAAEIGVAGGVGQAQVKQYAARQAADGKVYVAMMVADLGGGVGLQFVRSDDTCQTWTAPLTIVGFGNVSHGVRAVSIGTGATGAAAIIYRGDLGFDPYVVATTNSGATWTTPVRIDTGVAARTFPVEGLDVTVHPTTGAIHAVYVQDRGPGLSIWRSTSTNGGTSFSAEVSFDSILAPSHLDSLEPDIEVAADGSILVTFWDSQGTDRIFVVRSTDGGTVYTSVLNQALALSGNGTNVPVRPTLAVGSNGTVLVAWIDASKRLSVARSATNGSAWDATQVLMTTGTASGSPIGILELTKITLTRTPAGNWVIGWSDDRSDTYAGMKTDVFVRSSTTDGQSWGPEQRCDSDTAGAAPSALADVAATGADGLFALFQDRRANGGRSADFYANRSATASTLAFGTDARVDTDATTISVDVNLDPTVATDGASRVYAAFSAFGTGPESDIYVAASANGGYTFAPAVRASAGTAGALIRALPRVRAFPDGKVYLTYVVDNAAGQREIRFNRSTDFGVTWSASDILLGTVLSPDPGYYSFFDRPSVQLEALADGTVYVAWSSETAILLARSTDFGASFGAAADVDQDPRTFQRAPRLCASGNTLVLVWEGANLEFTRTSIWSVVSANKGVAWGAPQQLRPEITAAQGGGVSLPALACNGTTAVAVWPDLRGNVQLQLWANLFNGTIWAGNVLVSTPAGLDASVPVAAFSGASNVVVTYEGTDGGIYASRSTDGGATFPSFQRLDGVVTNSAALSLQPRIAADGGTNLWASWLDESPGLPMLVSRRSGDGGATWDNPRRIDRKVPNGGSSSFYFLYDAAFPAVLPGAAFFTWAAERDSFLTDAMLNAYDLDDMDRDGFLVGSDCDDTNAAIGGTPPALPGPALGKVAGNTRLTWAPPAGTLTDIASGLLSSLRGTGGFTGATCLATALGGTTYDDLQANPPSGDGRWYLIRSTNACGDGSYGNSSLPVDPRDALDAGPVCD
jgi:hypothetical protein